MRRIYIILAAGFVTFPLISQGIKDSVFMIDAVEIKAERIFLKEEAGMKQSELDTAILRGKVNLSLSDLLSEHTSVFIKNHGRGALATASFRGTAASHTQISWNGIQINSPMTGMADFSLIPVFIIDELNLKHGAASLADRGGGIGGSINITNTADWKGEKVIQYMQGMGSYSTFDEFLSLGFGNQKFRIRTRLYHNYSRNDYTFINRGKRDMDPVTGEFFNPLDTNENAAYLRYGLLQEIHYRPRSGQVVSVIYWGQHADRSVPKPTSYEGPDNSNLNNQLDTDHKMVASWKYFAPYGKFLVRSGYSGKKLDYTQNQKIPGLGTEPFIHSESNQNSFLNTISYSFEPGPDLSVEGKLNVNHHDVNSRDTLSRAGYEKQRTEVSVYTALHRSFGDRLNLNVMLRQDWVDGERVPVIPFFGFDYRLRKGTDLILKGSIARNYHQPTLNDLYWQPGGNPDLLEEKGFTLEAGLEYQKVFRGQRLKTGFTAYRSDIDNWILWIPSYRGYWEPVNIREVLSTGVEYDLHVTGNLGPVKYRLSGTYAWTSSVNHGDSLVWGDASYGKQLVYIPLHSGNIMIRLAFRNLHITYQYNAYSERFTSSSNDLTRRDWLYPYFMNNIALGGDFRIRKVGLSAELKTYNIFNESYHSILYRPMPGRNYHLILKIEI